MGFEEDMRNKIRAIRNRAVELGKSQIEDGWSSPIRKDELGPYFDRWIVQEADLYVEMPDPARFEYVRRDLEAVMGRLSPGMVTNDPLSQKPIRANPNIEMVPNAKGRLSAWDGDAADAFEFNFIDPFRPRALNFFIMLSTLRSAGEATQAMWAHARQDLSNLLDQTLNALHEKGKTSNNGWVITFTIIEAIAVLAAVPTGGLSLAGVAGAEGAAWGVAAVGAAAGAAANWPRDPEPPPSSYTSEAAWDIVSDMRSALGRLAREVRQVENRIAEALSHNNDAMAASRSLFVTPAPAMANLSGSDIRTRFNPPG